MRRNPLSRISSVVLRRAQAGGQESARFLNSRLVQPHISPSLRVFPTRSLVFLDIVAIVWQPVSRGRTWGWKQSP